MDIRRGLERVNAACWGVLAVLLTLFAFSARSLSGAAICIGVCAAGFFLVRWIIRGFLPESDVPTTVMYTE